MFKELKIKNGTHCKERSVSLTFLDHVCNIIPDLQSTL